MIDNPTPISGVLITLNAASQIKAALESLSFCSEIIVVDSGSTDATIQICEAAGAKVIQKEWIGFGPQKQFAVDQTSNPWVLCLDADERVTPQLAQSIHNVLNGISMQAGSNIAGYRMPRCNFFLGRYLRHGEGYPDLSLRLFHKDRARWSDDAVHEKVELRVPGGTWGSLEGDLLHESAENLSTYLTKQNRYTLIQAQQLAERGKWPSATKLVLSPLVRFIKFYFIRQGFRDGWQGFVHIVIGCFNSMIKYAKARELIQNARR